MLPLPLSFGWRSGRLSAAQGCLLRANCAIFFDLLQLFSSLFACKFIDQIFLDVRIANNNNNNSDSNNMFMPQSLLLRLHVNISPSCGKVISSHSILVLPLNFSSVHHAFHYNIFLPMYNLLPLLDLNHYLAILILKSFASNCLSTKWSKTSYDICAKFAAKIQ